MRPFLGTKQNYLSKRPLHLIDIRNAVRYLKQHGVSAFIHKIAFLLGYSRSYRSWIRRNEPRDKDLDKQKTVSFLFNPRISIVTQVFNTHCRHLGNMIDSVISQTFSNWELCIAYGGSIKPHVRDMLKEFAAKDGRIKLQYLDADRGCSGISNTALSLAGGDYIAFVGPDDILAPFALFELVKTINENNDADFLYSDEDNVTEDGRTRLNPNFKPDWSPDMLRSYNYIGHLMLLRRDLLNETGWFGDGFEGSQDYDITLRTSQQANKIVHIPKVLYHRRALEKSVIGTAQVRPYGSEAAKKALDEHIMRLGMDGSAENVDDLNCYRIRYRISGNPKVSIIIPNKDNLDDLRRCLTSISEKTSYKNYEIIIVENNSSKKETFDYYRETADIGKARIIIWEDAFNYSAINNFAVKHAAGDMLLFLNNDTEIINIDWLESMLELVVRKDVGAVGAKLYYPDDTIQHGGVILGLMGIAGHAHRHFSRESAGYMGRLQVIQNLSAVTGACLMTRKEVFEEVGGFDEKLSLTWNDVDYCLKVRENGYLIIWTPYAELYHHELRTRGTMDTDDKYENCLKDEAYFRGKWGHYFEKGDPYYNPNLSLQREDFSLS